MYRVYREGNRLTVPPRRAGFTDAKARTDFFSFVSNDPDHRSYVVLALQDGLLVVAPFEQSNGQYQRTLLIKSITDHQIGELTPITVKPLTATAP